jgi:hypothetical protein
MQTNLQITYADKTVKAVSTTPADIVALERTFEISIARLGTDFKMTHLYFLAWSVENRTKATELEFESWLEVIEGVDSETPKVSKG